MVIQHLNRNSEVNIKVIRKLVTSFTFFGGVYSIETEDVRFKLRQKQKERNDFNEIKNFDSKRK